MGKFTKAVQDGAVPGPLRSEFKIKHWQAEYSRLGDDEDDKNLRDAGLMIYEKANNIRSNLKVTFSKELRVTTKVRGFAALANHNFCVLNDKTKQAFAEAAARQHESHPGMPVMMHELAALKLKLAVGAEYGIDEIVQSMVDGMQVPLKRILEHNPDLSGNSEFGRLDWNHLVGDFNLGNLYAHIEGLWDDCLWNHYQVTQKGHLITFSPRNPAWQLREVASRVRFDALNREFSVHSLQVYKNLIYSGRLKMLGSIDVKAIVKDGRRQLIQMAPFDPESQDLHRLLTMRVLASEPYYKELLQEPQVQLLGATLDNVLAAWAVISRASSVLREELVQLKVKMEAETKAWLPKYAPVLQIGALARAISIACHTSLAQSKALVEFFIFRGKGDQELWAQPLLPVSKEAVVPIFSTVFSPNLRRLVDVWMRQLGVDLGLRGPAFEAHIRAAIRTDIAQSPLLNDSWCFEVGVKFTPPNDREEEIDVVAMIGNVVIIGEAKCFLDPAETKQTAMHRIKVIDAVNQVKRKADAVRRNIEAFRARILQLGFELPSQFDVLPVVILNSAIHCGIPVDGVPIIDEYILGVFFRGEFVEMAVSEAGGELKTVRKRILYTSAAEASDIVADFFAAPPQIDPLLAGVSERWVPVPAVSDEDWVGEFLTLECVPKVTLPTESEIGQEIFSA